MYYQDHMLTWFSSCSLGFLCEFLSASYVPSVFNTSSFNFKKSCEENLGVGQDI